MTEFGKTLREAREAKGLTTSQIAESTRVLPSIIQGLENEDFSKIVAPIYGRGFVKLYCEAVGIDAKPLVAEFMALYSGTRTPNIRERAPSAHAAPPVHAAPPPPVQPAPVQPPPRSAPVATPPPQPDFDSIFATVRETPPPPAAPAPQRPAPAAPQRPASAPQHPAPQAVPQTAPRAAEPPPRPRDPLPRYAAPLRDMDALKPRLPTINLPPNLWRIVIVVIAAILLLWGIVAGIRALYRVTTDRTPPTAPSVERAVATPTPAQPAPKPAVKPATTKPAAKPAPAIKPSVVPRAPTGRKPQKIPSLYID